MAGSPRQSAYSAGASGVKCLVPRRSGFPHCVSSGAPSPWRTSPWDHAPGLSRSLQYSLFFSLSPVRGSLRALCIPGGGHRDPRGVCGDEHGGAPPAPHRPWEGQRRGRQAFPLGYILYSYLIYHGFSPLCMEFLREILKFQYEDSNFKSVWGPRENSLCLAHLKNSDT